jgi:hypothetical protein
VRRGKLSTELPASAVEFEDARVKEMIPPSEEQALAAIARAFEQAHDGQLALGPPKVVRYLPRETIIALS